MGKLTWFDMLDPAYPPSFPPTTNALQEPNGLLAVGGDLSTERLLAAYRRGVFPWYEPGQPILWWAPDPRMVLVPAERHISRSLSKVLRQRRFRTTADTAFSAVISACAGPRRGVGGTWITPEMRSAYEALHTLGYAHSIEVWQDDLLVGGLYGVALGQIFYGESMFSHRSNASKVAFASLAQTLQNWRYRLIDCQVASEHLYTLGAKEIPRAEFEAILHKGLNEAPRVPAIGSWRELWSMEAC